ncbi:MAG: ArnT family glycosyltransferase [Phycisphaerales bacterium]
MPGIESHAEAGRERATPAAHAPHTAHGALPALLMLGAALLVARLAYLAWLCPFDLVEDEAQYWDWSRHLDWSYYTKGPGIAWLIALSTKALGVSDFAVRAPAAVCSSVATVFVGLLAAEISGSRRVAVLAALALQLAPVMQVVGLLGTIDGPLCACWAAAAWCGWRALGGGRWSWVGLGLALGVGVLFKYTMLLLLLPGLVWAWWLGHRSNQERFRAASASERSSRGWVAAGVITFAVSVMPIVIWNAQHGWGALRHLLGRVGVSEATGPLAQAVSARAWSWSPMWVLEYLGTQLGMVGPLLVLALVAVWRAGAEHRLTRRASRVRHGESAIGGTEGGGTELGGTGAGERYLAACGLPVLVFYLLVSLLRAPEGNWPLAAYVTLLPLAGIAAAEGVARRRELLAVWRGGAGHRGPRGTSDLGGTGAANPRAGFFSRKPETVGQVLWHWGVGYGLGAAVLILALSVAPTLPWLSAYVPVARLTQGRTLAGHVHEQRLTLDAGAPGSVMVIATDYGKASHLAFYLPDRPATFCTSSLFGGRPTNHDFWPETDLRNPALRGRAAVLVGGTMEQWTPLFERVEDLGLARGLERKGMHLYRAWGFVPAR